MSYSLQMPRQGSNWFTTPCGTSRDGFWYGYHRDSHTSLVGMREGAAQHRCFGSDDEVDQWISEPSVPADRIGLFAYPAQSNMNGRRLPRDWCFRVRSSKPNADLHNAGRCSARADRTPGLGRCRQRARLHGREFVQNVRVPGPGRTCRANSFGSCPLIVAVTLVVAQ